MILKGNQRAGAKQLARHLLNDRDNEHVEVHELRGFLSGDLQSALHEAYAVSRGTRATKFLFSLSLNPPSHERVSVETFEAAIDAVEQKLGLEGQQRAVVFHEKDGRRHAHVVWSRIDTEKMKAIELGLYKLKLREVSRELFLENGWQMPRGLVNSRERDPKNFTRDEWEQAKRGRQDPKAMKGMFQECWSISDSAKAFAQALQARGYTLARGDSRSHVAIDFRGEVYAVAKWVGIKTKDVRARLGDGSELPSVEQAMTATAGRMIDMLRRHIDQADAAYEKQAATLAFRRSQVLDRQRKERAQLAEMQEKRWAKENAERAKRLSKGFRGLWDRLTGTYGKQARENEREAWECLRRDRREKDALIERHIDERQTLHQIVRHARQTHSRDVAALHRDIATYNQMRAEGRAPDVKEHFRETGNQRTTKRPEKDRGPKREI